MTGTAAPVHTLSDRQIDEIGSGRPGPGTLRVLAAGQRSRRLLLLTALGRRLAGDPLAAGRIAEARAILSRAAAAHPGAVERIVTRPLAAAWAVTGLDQLRRAGDADVPAIAARLSGEHLALAAAAAVRSGTTVTVTVPTPAGELWLPGIGLLRGLHCPETTIGTGPDGFTAGCPHRVHTPAGTHRRLAIDPGEGWEIDLDDEDPSRNCFGYPPAPRLDDAAAAAFTQLLRDAWRLLLRDHTEQARIVRAHLRSIVPVLPDRAEALAQSSTSNLATGAMALTLDMSPDTAAELLVHETRHGLLVATGDLVALCAEAGEGLHHAPWRLDPRPVSALLQGAYAHSAVTEHWQRRRALDEKRDEADFQFAYWREVTTAAIATLGGSDELTPAGARLVDRMASVSAGWWDDPVPDQLGRKVRRFVEADAVHWRLLNQHLPDGVADGLAAAFRAGRACPPLPDPEVHPAPRAALRHSRAAVALLDPAHDANRDAGRRSWRERLADADDLEAWVGLATVAEGPAAAALTRRPEVVRAVVTRIAGADPEDVAVWVGRSVH
jgi:HEXXH motif-containing protein